MSTQEAENWLDVPGHEGADRALVVPAVNARLAAVVILPVLLRGDDQ